MKKLGVIAIVLVAVVAIGYSCGGGGSSGSSADTTVRHIAVDPYIVGAKFFEDLDGDEVQDLDEQLSSLTDANGLFTFSSPLTTGAFVVLSDTVIGPLHNGVSYTGIVKRKVEGTGALVCSPLTTLLANGWEPIDIVTVLSNAGLTTITTTDLTKNPMEGIENLTTVTEPELVKIRSSIAIYSFMAIMDELIAGQGYDITYITFTANTVTTTPALQAMVSSINYCLSHTLLTTIQDQMSGAPPGTPQVTVGDIIKSSVAVANYIIPQVVISPTTFAPNYVTLALLGQKLGVNFYAIRNKSNSLLIAGINSAIPEVLITDITTFNSLKVDGGGNVVGVQ